MLLQSMHFVFDFVVVLVVCLFVCLFFLTFSSAHLILILVNLVALQVRRSHSL